MQAGDSLPSSTAFPALGSQAHTTMPDFFFFLTWASGVVHRSSCFQDKHVVNRALLSPFLIGGSLDLAMFIKQRAGLAILLLLTSR